MLDGCDFASRASYGIVRGMKSISCALLWRSMKEGKNLVRIAASRFFSMAKLTPISPFCLARLLAAITLLLELLFWCSKLLNPSQMSNDG